MARSPITPLVVQFQNLTEDEQKIFLDLVDPQPEPEAPAKRASKKRGARSARASSMAAAIKNNLEQGKQAEEKASGQLCVGQVPGLNVECGNTEDNGIHDPNGGYGGYHEFQAPKSKKAAK